MPCRAPAVCLFMKLVDWDFMASPEVEPKVEVA
jgi:hypothetical protein